MITKVEERWRTFSFRSSPAATTTLRPPSDDIRPWRNFYLALPRLPQQHYQHRWFENLNISKEEWQKWGSSARGKTCLPSLILRFKASTPRCKHPFGESTRILIPYVCFLDFEIVISKCLILRLMYVINWSSRQWNYWKPFSLFRFCYHLEIMISKFVILYIGPS